MHLTRIQIKNFRSLQDVTVSLQSGLNVIVGRNNTGKSNLLAAIRHAIGPAGARGEALWLTRDDFFKTSQDSEPLETLSVSLTFEGLSESQRAAFYEIVEFDLVNPSQSKAHLHFEATWPKGKRQARVDRWGGKPGSERTSVPAEILAALPVTFLPALRDAEAALVPGIRNRLAVLLKDLANRKHGDDETNILKIYRAANSCLEAQPIISETKDSLQTSTKSMAGTDYSPSIIRAAEADFERILRTLSVQMATGPIGDLAANGLGYNNLLYIAVVLEHLKSSDADECPLLLVEEPEAHLHPQLTTLLAEYLSRQVPAAAIPQTIVTTHSPTLAASVPPSRVHVLFSEPPSECPCCNSLSLAGMDEKEEMALQRMLDVTRATLYFAKGAILVEGISEALLIPVLAKRMGVDLASLHVSVIPICGVSFNTFQKLLQPNALGIPVAIITDGDPSVPDTPSWKTDTPTRDGDSLEVSDRTRSLLAVFMNHPTVQVHHSQVTLEYDLAEAGPTNAGTMADVWKECFQRTPGTFTAELLNNAGDSLEEKALCAWRGICRASHSGSKAEFAQRLAAALDRDSATTPISFEVPSYIKNAISFVSQKLSPVPTQDGGTIQ